MLFSSTSRRGWSRVAGGVRADVFHEKSVALGYMGSARTSRPAVAIARRQFLQGQVLCVLAAIDETGQDAPPTSGLDPSCLGGQGRDSEALRPAVFVAIRLTSAPPFPKGSMVAAPRRGCLRPVSRSHDLNELHQIVQSTLPNDEERGHEWHRRAFGSSARHGSGIVVASQARRPPSTRGCWRL